MRVWWSPFPDARLYPIRSCQSLGTFLDSRQTHYPPRSPAKAWADPHSRTHSQDAQGCQALFSIHSIHLSYPPSFCFPWKHAGLSWRPVFSPKPSPGDTGSGCGPSRRTWRHFLASTTWDWRLLVLRMLATLEYEPQTVKMKGSWALFLILLSQKR